MSIMRTQIKTTKETQFNGKTQDKVYGYIDDKEMFILSVDYDHYNGHEYRVSKSCTIPDDIETAAEFANLLQSGLNKVRMIIGRRKNIHKVISELVEKYKMPRRYVDVVFEFVMQTIDLPFNTQMEATKELVEMITEYERKFGNEQREETWPFMTMVVEELKHA